MPLKDKLLPILKNCGDNYLSGEDAAKMLGVSRTAVWKAITALKADGYNIEAVTNRGYRISENSDVLCAAEIAEGLGALSKKLNIETVGTVTSTNAVLKEKAAAGAPEGTVLIAGGQTAGRGRFTRKFHSPQDSGIYMSIILRPQIPAEKAVLITTAAAVAVAEAVEALSGKKTAIKWVNDIFADGKKICGILTEASLNIESGTLNYAVLGIGLNVYEPSGGFPAEISNIAGAVFDSRSGGLKNRISAEIIARFFKYYETVTDGGQLAPYRERCMLIGENITVLKGDTSRSATALGIDDSCRLHVKYENGSEEYLSSGEISVKPL